MRVVGIVLVRNEAFYIERAIGNVLAFCDELIVCDHGSTDGTPRILQRLANAFPEKISLHSIRTPRGSHELLKPHMGSDAWIFAVDGDEIYDPAGLERLRLRLEKGEFANDWVLFGNVLNVRILDKERGVASGYLAPPCRSMTKLFNFAAIDAWDGDTPERLHGGRIRFREGFHAGLRRNLHEGISWEEADFRCLHLCFLPRSPGDEGSRPNIMDRHAWSAGKWWSRFRAALTGRKPAGWKEEKYARGPLVEKDVRAFFMDGGRAR